MIKPSFKIGNRIVGDGNPVLVVAEVSANHLQDIERAKKTVKLACELGAGAIKIQTYTPDSLTLNSSNEPFQIKVNPAWKGKTLYGLYQEAYMPLEWHKELIDLSAGF